MKILVATEKPFAPVAVEGIREIIQGAGFSFELLEKYTDKNSLIEAVSQADWCNYTQRYHRPSGY